MTTTYYIGAETITSTSTVGITIERYSDLDYWKVRLSIQDVLTNAMINSLIVNKASCAISIEDLTGTVTFTGVVVSWESSTNYSFVNLVNCTCTKT